MKSLHPSPRPILLFVDDDQRVLDGLAASLRRLRSEWTMEFVCGGGDAVRRMEAGPIDVVVTDMRMPGTDGEAVLVAARALRPGALRIVLSGQTDRVVVQRTVEIAHQFLSKPCAFEELCACIRKLLAVASGLDGPTRNVVCSAGDFGASPTVLAELRVRFGEATPDPVAIAACIERDASLTARLLHAANAGFFATRRPSTTVASALTVLGVETAVAVLLSTRAAAIDSAVDRLSRRSERMGALVERMIGGDDARLCGVLHGVGKRVLLAHFGGAYAELLDLEDDGSPQRLATFEESRFGMTHDVVGAHVLALSGASSTLVDAIRTYRDPVGASDTSELALALHLACALTSDGGAIDQRLLSRQDVASRLPAWRDFARMLEDAAPLGHGLRVGK